MFVYNINIIYKQLDLEPLCASQHRHDEPRHVPALTNR